MLLNRVDLSKGQAVSCFLSGLCEEIQCAVRMFKPVSLHEAYCLAKLQEATLTLIFIKAKPILDKNPGATRSFSSYKGSLGGTRTFSQSRVFPRYPGARTNSDSGSIGSSTSSVTSKPREVLTFKEINEKGLLITCVSSVMLNTTLATNVQDKYIGWKF